MIKTHPFRPSLFRCRTYSTVGTCLAVWLLLLPAVDSHAFGPTGHRVVGRIAEQHLTPEARHAVKRIMGAESLAEAATWPDEIRSDPMWDHTASWHYVTIEDGETYETSTKQPHDVIESIDRFVLQLRDPNAPPADKVLAIRWLVHLVGDVHQPLHVGRGADRGGNRVKAVWFGKDTNMHFIWDEGLIESTKLSFSELAAFIDTESPEKIAAWQNSTVLNWAEESVEYRSRVYEVPAPPDRPGDNNGSYKYAYKNVPLVEQRMVQAGVRLAGLLNAIFTDGSETAPPTR